MNMGYEDEELLPFKEPSIDLTDQKRIEILIGMGYSRKEVEESLQTAKFDDCYASYLLLGRKPSDVSIYLAYCVRNLLYSHYADIKSETLPDIHCISTPKA